MPSKEIGEATTSPVIWNVLEVSNCVAVVAVPVKSPIKVLAVTIPVAFTLVSEILSSRSIVIVSDAADEVKLVPPEIVRLSVKRSITSDPLSPETVKAVPTADVPATVKRPLESTVNVGISVEEP